MAEPTMEKNGFTVDRDEDLQVKMGLLYDLMGLIGDLDPGWDSVTTPECVVELCRAVMKPDQNRPLANILRGDLAHTDPRYIGMPSRCTGR